MNCRWLRETPEFRGFETSHGVIIGNCDLLGDTATDLRCDGCPHRSDRQRRRDR